MSGSGGDQNNDGLDDTTGKNIFGGTNKKMTDEEREELDQEIMDLLNEEDQEKSMSSGGSYKDSIPDSERDETGWQPGDKVPSPGVKNNTTGTFSVDGKQVTEAEYNANQKARESFVDQATNPNSKFHQEAFAAETLRSEGKDYQDNEHKQQYEEEQNNSQAYFENQQKVGERLNEVMKSGYYQNLNTQQKQQLQMSIGANNKDLQKAEIKALGEYLGSSRNQKNPKAIAVLQGILGNASNVNELPGYGELTGKEYAEALFEGLNLGSGVDAPGLGTGFDLPGDRFDFKGFDAFKGIGGTKYNIDEKGNMTIQGFGDQVGSTLVNVGKNVGVAALTKGAAIPQILASSANYKQGVMNIQDFFKDTNILGTGQNKSLTVSPSNILSSGLSKGVFNKVAPGIAKEVFVASDGNMGLTQGALAASKLGIDEAIGRAIDQMNMGEIDLLNPGSSSSNTPKGSGKSTATVNVGKSGQTSTIQSDLKSEPESRKDYSNDAQDSLSRSLKSSSQSFYDDGGGDNDQDAAPGFLQTTKPLNLDVNTLQNLNPTNTTPLTTMNNDASLMMNAIGNTFGGRYLQRGRNRDTGSVTTRRATRRDVEKDKRRSGILFG